MAILCGKRIVQEVIDSIVCQLPNDKKELSNCSLISHSFSLPSQRRLFRSLSLEINDSPGWEWNIERFRDIYATLSAREVFLYVQSLCISVGKCGPSTAALIQVVDKLVNLKRVTINCMRLNSAMWLDNDLVRRCCRPTVTYFAASHAQHLDWYYLQQCPSLQHLSLRHSTLGKYAPPEYASMPPTPVTSFLFEVPPEDTEPFCHWMLHARCPIDVQALSAFAIVNPYDIDCIVPILPVIPKTLKSLAIQPFGCSESDQQFGPLLPSLIIDLSTFPQLSCLTLSVYDSYVCSHAPSWVFEELSSIPFTNTLTELYLIIATGIVDRSFSELQDLWQHWKSLDNMLMDRKFNQLEVVVMHIQACDRNVNVEGVLPMFLHLLPQTTKHKTLDIHVTYPFPYSTLEDDFPKLGEEYHPTLGWRY